MRGTLDLRRRLHKSSNRRFNSREECDGVGRSWSNVGIRGSLRRRDNICSHQIPFSSLSWGRTPFGAVQFWLLELPQSLSLWSVDQCVGHSCLYGRHHDGGGWGGGDPWSGRALSRWAGRSSQGSYDTARVWTLSTLCNLPYCAPMRPAVVSCSDFLIM